ncbi:MAG: hypothetical protein EKK64_07970 [Neisseriaceae bacterium]|nr:MAG: hypothetical protein EKK64_07970 [Neisseriaceae bacterium]
MKTLTINKKIINGDYLMGSFLDENSFDELINYDCDVYDVSGILLAKFRKNILSKEKLINCVENVRSSIVKMDNRGIASGRVELSKTMNRQGSHITENFKLQPITKDGKLSKYKVGNCVLNGLIGYMDRTVMMPYCRKTAFTKNEFEKFEKAIPFIQEVNEKFKELIPEKWKIQNEYAKATDKNYIIKDTCFTTVTINKDFQTAVHKDAGDLKKGFGNLTSYKTDGLKGGYFVLPQWRIAFDLCSCDLLLVDVHQWHGNTPMTKESEEDERISFVMYYREKTIKCLAPKDELERVKRANNKT